MKQRIIALLLVLAGMFVLLCSCRAKNTDELYAEELAPHKFENRQTPHKADFISIKLPIELTSTPGWSVNPCKCGIGYTLFLGNAQNRSHIYALSADNNGSIDDYVDISCKETDGISYSAESSLCSTDGSKLLAVFSMQKDEEYAGMHFMHCFSSGNVKNEFDIEDGERVYRAVKLDGQKIYCIYSMTENSGTTFHYEILDTDGEVKSDSIIPLEAQSVGAAINIGNIGIVGDYAYIQYTEISETEYADMLFFFSVNDSLCENALCASIPGKACVCLCGEYDYIYSDGTVYMAGFLDGSEPFALFDSGKAGLDSYVFGIKYISSPYSLFLTGTNIITYERCCMMLQIDSEKYVGEDNRAVISAAYTEKSQLLELAIADFNRKNEDYRIDPIFYDGSEQLEYDMAVGYSPDLIISCHDAQFIYSLSEKNALVDLYDYLSGSKISGSKLIDAVLSPFEYDGKLTSLVSHFSVDTLIVKESLLGRYNYITPSIIEGRGWTTDEFLDFAALLGEGTVLLKDGSTVISQEIINYALSSFVDSDNAECEFDTETFYRFLDYIKETEKPRDGKYTGSPDEYRNNSIALYHQTTISHLYQLAYISAYMCSGDDTALCVGYPDENGNGSYIIPQFQLAITKNSSNPEGAWSFIEYFFSPEYQYISDSELTEIPTTCNALDIALNDCKYYAVGINSDGHIDFAYLPNSDKFQSTFNNADMPRKDRFTESDIIYTQQWLYNLKSVKNGGIINDELIGIINEEISAFTDGEQTAMRTAEILNNRVSLFLSERS